MIARRLARILLSLAAVILCLPLVRFGLQALWPAADVDRSSAAWQAREALVARAHVFVASPPAIPAQDFSHPPGDPAPFDRTALVECRYVPRPITGTTPKFDCRLPDGGIIKVKYGDTPERRAEAAATQLLAALGFGADHVTLLPRLRCLGCPPRPYETRKFMDWFFASWLLDLVVSDDHPTDFDWVSAERRMAGRAIEVDPYAGWDWTELSLVDSAKGGATRADLDAFELIAIFLGHWDNKASNQRLVCEEGPGGSDPAAPCATPLLMIHDVGATFGPGKVEEKNWAATPIWADPARCIVDLPHQDGTFRPFQISEAGRALMAARLRQLSEAQIRALFQAAGFPESATGDVTGNVTLWVRIFQDKVRQIADRPACPALSR